MSSTLFVTQNLIVQEKDHQTFPSGNFTITFDYPFSDLSFTFDKEAPGITINEISRTTTSVLINCSGLTSEGYYRASGRGVDYSVSSQQSSSASQRVKILVPLVSGSNVLPLPTGLFLDANYVVSIDSGSVTAYVTAKTADNFTVFSSDDNPNFSCTVTS